MAVIAKKKVWTDEELMRIKHEGKVELVDGELKLMTPAGGEQGAISADLLTRLNNFVRRKRLGRVFDAQTGFRPYENLRAPDISFVRIERLPEGKPPKGFLQIPPDLAVEVLGLNETFDDYEEKVSEYLSWGVRLIWLVDPNTQKVMVVRQSGEKQVLKGNDVLSGEDVVPGFKVKVKKIFA
ncbi:MAG: Uma2 family endonuclease [Armatimonadetes bacterium]|nr:Uma2 family endonuclease [Armatimonadota bacterium]MDW8029225.1 Uma2 family endonuclease [Armatimonadota bacterium]